jgi:hypothetical protein
LPAAIVAWSDRPQGILTGRKVILAGRKVVLAGRKVVLTGRKLF